MKKASFIKGILVGVVIVLMSIMFMGFGSGAMGTRFNPMYVILVSE